ncbi:PREDICTED: chloroplastic lipocalin isoform X2 [Camelina sativa]|uniref:Chloroplastic lipocalin isoform X2 n=1 Tax=Camelina sativa TaxID=90675 RepID=A0ABM0YMX4_CAMSA|nr:PREDICTED: chloroplastic lipocalin isoform X2 [Camelina sativa]
MVNSSISISRPVFSHGFSPPAATTTSRCSLIRIDRRSHCSVTVKCYCTSSTGFLDLKCSLEKPIGNLALRKHLVSGLAAILLLSQAGQGVALDLSSGHQNICQLGSAAVEENNKLTLPLESPSDGGDPETMMMMMMRGMTAKNFDPVRYSGRWFEVASLKRGFAGQGQEDCHCTQGVYSFDMKEPAIRVDTFCVHGSPDGYITGIRGKVQCIGAEDLEKSETDLEKQEMIKEKCFLRFPTIPFIPKLPYDVIATDYDNYALVSGAKDKGFVQIYSRTPNPGPEFIAKNKNYLAQFGYDPEKIKDTPQDCEVMSDGELAAMMTMPGMEKTLTNQFPDLELRKSVQFDPFTSVFETLKKLVPLYFK